MLPGRLFGRIEKSDIAEQREIALVGDGIRRFRVVDLLVSDGDNAKAVLVERDGFFLGRGEVAFVERALRAVDLISGGDRENFLDRAPADENVLVVPVRDHN